MHKSTILPANPVAWVKRVNNRWIVHEGLDQQSNAYIEHLKKIDPERLLRSCIAAYKMVHKRNEIADPKPRFYGGLFCLATPKEAKEFLSTHEFILNIIPASPRNQLDKFTKNLAYETTEQMLSLRNELSELQNQLLN